MNNFIRIQHDQTARSFSNGWQSSALRADEIAPNARAFSMNWPTSIGWVSKPETWRKRRSRHQPLHYWMLIGRWQPETRTK